MSKSFGLQDLAHELKKKQRENQDSQPTPVANGGDGYKDPRAGRGPKLVPPPPLPYVSRRSLKKITGWMAPPEHCRYCGDAVFLVTNDEIYGRRYGEWPYAYKCIGCDANVGLHPHTDIPLGTLADKALREARKNKKLHIQLTRQQKWSRLQSYAWLAKQMSIEVKDCHWGWFDLADCEKAATICQDALDATRDGQRLTV